MPRALLLAACLAACSRSSAPAPDAPSASASAPAPAPAPAPASPSAPASASIARCPASLDDRTAEARSLYGPGVRLATVGDAFLFVDPDHSPLFEQSVRFAPRVLSALRHDRIGPRPLCPVSVYLFASRDRFEAHCAGRHYLPDSGKNLGVYDRVRGEIVTDLSGGPSHVPTTAHELAHVLMDADADRAPLWFRECVASLYESPVLPAPGEIHGTGDWRYVQLRAAVTARDPAAHLGALFGMSDDDFRGRSDGGGMDGTRSLLHRAMARATCQWLDAQGQLWPLYRGWRDDFAASPDGVTAFTRVTGRAPADPAADDAWRAWVLRTR